MLGHLRFHRRGHSNPSSPVVDQLSPFDQAEHPHTVQDISSRPDFLPRPSNATNTPPVHPPSSRAEPPPAAIFRKPSEQSLKEITSPPSASVTQYGAEAAFMGGVALQNYRRAFESNRQASSATVNQPLPDKTKFRNKPLPPPINTDLPPKRPPSVPAKEVKHAASFTIPFDSQHTAGATGKRPAGTRLTSEPSALAGTQTATEIQKSKERISLWKKPVSGLLMRRKASQNAPDIRPLPLPQKASESTFDPRIRGTRVHDFSAPRQRVVPTRKATVPGAEVWTGWESRDGYSQASASSQSNTSDLPADLPLRTRTGNSAGSSSTKTVEPSPDTTTRQSSELTKEPSQKSTRQVDRLSLENKPLPEQPPPPPPSNKDDASTRSASNRSRPISAASSMKQTNPSTRTNRSRHISLSDGSIRDSLPKHMKSTSSRFSFDMIGAARAEKLLEERHRQKELERKANDPGPTRRDSRFDEFDEDNFDYDAAMDDDGLEERIPGVNADFDDDDGFFEEAPFEEDIPMLGEVEVIDEEDDPDNDQENFAGFVFARSNPHSSLVSPASPGMIATPRDANGRPIGHAITKDGTPSLSSALSPMLTESDDSEGHQDHLDDDDDGDFSGLGIQGLQAPPKSTYDPTVFQERRNMESEDPLSGSTAGHDNELYFDRGLQEELQMAADEIQQSTIDESIFDIDDTDQFGRPIPGAFAQAMKAVKEQEQQKKRESDMTSQSGMSASTAHTSVSVLQSSTLPTDKLDGIDSVAKDSPPTTSPSQSTEDKVAAYLQQALAKAAASDLNSRWADTPESSPAPGDPDVTITSPTTASSQPNSAGLMDDPASHIYDDDGFGRGFDDDYDDDDDFGADFIAEANAEALAYDSEGFYGQEFGFYSAPLPPHHSSTPSNGFNGSLGSDTFYGGYFGPSGGLNRSASGHVTREPNLTPITERSEYSNRNSIMSLGLPSAALPTSAGLDGRNAMQSPGLSTLMGMDDGDFSLSGLYRLRNKAFGGSQISLSSSKEGSPRSERAPTFEERHPPPWDMGRPPSHLGLAPGGGSIHHVRKGSNYSLWSTSDAAASNPNSPSMVNVSLPGYNVPPQPLTSPPPIPQPSPGPVAVSQCLPVIEDDDEENGLMKTGSSSSSSAVGGGGGGDVSPARTLKGVSVFATGARGGSASATPSTVRSRTSSSGDVLGDIARANHIAFMANNDKTLGDARPVSSSEQQDDVPPMPTAAPPPLPDAVDHAVQS